MRQHRQRPRLPFDLVDQQVDEPRLDLEAGTPRRPLDRLPQVRLGHPPEQVQPALDDPREGRVCCQVDEVVGAHGEHELTRADPGSERGEEGSALLEVAAQREHLLALVHEEHRSRRSGHGRERRHRVVTRRQHRHLAAVPEQGGGDACADD